MAKDTDPQHLSLHTLSAALKQRQITSADLTEQMLERIAKNDSAGVVFTAVFEAQAREAAQQADQRWSAGTPLSPIDGIPISIKDLFDVEGLRTLAGSRVLDHVQAPVAQADATAIARLKQAGAVILGRTNMTEFAYSGLGINPHHGTPLSPWDRGTQRVAGGSSSGAAVSVSDGVAAAAIGTDTGGSVRIPAAFCGLTGFKPTASRVDQTGAIPLSPSLDSIGPIGHRVSCCQWLDALMAGEDQKTLWTTAAATALAKGENASRPVLGVPKQLVTEGMDETVAQAFAQATEALQRAGFVVQEVDLPELYELATMNASGGLTAAESWQWHKGYLQHEQARYDPRVAVRILRGEAIDAQAYQRLLDQRQDWITRVHTKISAFDALWMPTVPVVPPAVAPLLESDEVYAQTNLLVLRNPSVINVLNGCALSLPFQVDHDGAPVGLMLASVANQDAALLRLGQRCEAVLTAMQ